MILSDIVILSFLWFAVPFIILVYGGFLLVVHPPKEVLRASLLGGLVVGIVNMLGDLLAYYAHWWHYNLSNLVLHVPLPFYIVPVLVYGSIAYLLIWRFWHGRGRWFSLLLLIGVPIFSSARDIYGALAQTVYATWQNVPAAIILTIVMWYVAFYGGYFLFRRLAPERVLYGDDEEEDEEEVEEEDGAEEAAWQAYKEIEPHFSEAQRKLAE